MFNSNAEFLDAKFATVMEGSRMYSERMARGRSVGSKDMTNEANSYKNKKGQFFQRKHHFNNHYLNSLEPRTSRRRSPLTIPVPAHSYSNNWAQ